MIFLQGFKIGRHVPRFVIVLAVALSIAACTIETGKGPALNQLDRLDTDLTRGVSRKSDVLFLLGEPVGSGSALFPTARTDHDIWYYDMQTQSFTSVEQKILLVYFDDDVFAGYLWFSNDSKFEIQ